MIVKKSINPTSMLRIYEKYKGMPVHHGEIKGVICGFTDNNLIMATEQNPLYSFRKFDKEGHFVEEEYKDKKYRYSYILESTVEAQHNDIQRDKRKV